MTVDVTYTYLSASSNDIVTTTTQITIPAGQSTAQFSVGTVTDQIVEGTENYSVSISNPQGGNFENPVLGNSSVTTYIIDASVLQFHISDDVYNDADSFTATVTGVTGGNYEAFQPGATATATITEVIDTTSAGHHHQRRS